MASAARSRVPVRRSAAAGSLPEWGPAPPAPWHWVDLRPSPGARGHRDRTRPRPTGSGGCSRTCRRSSPRTTATRAALIDLGKAGGMLDARDNLADGPVRLDHRPGAEPQQPRQPVPHRRHDVPRPVPRPRHDLRHDVAAGRADRARGDAQRPHARARPGLGVRRGARSPTRSSNPTDRIKLRIESGGLFEDLPRQANGTAIIADPRNDENVIIAGLQAAMILFHNRVVDQLRGQGVPPSSCFDRARQLVTWHYQWIIVNEFLPQIVGYGVDAGHPAPRPALLPAGAGPGVHPGGVPGRRVPVRAQHGAPVVPGQPGRQRRTGSAVLRHDLRSGRRGPGRPGRPARRPARPPPVHRLADVLRLRRRPGAARAAEQADRHARSPPRCSTCRSARSPAATRRPRCRSATCCAT